MASGGSGSEAAVADIFEVFKIARTPLEQLTALPLETRAPHLPSSTDYISHM